MTGTALQFLEQYGEELVAVRRDLHAHPEVGRQERRTTAVVARRLADAGLAPQLLGDGVGLWCDVGVAPGAAPEVVLRADLDALPIHDGKDVPYRSTVAGVCHACGHDVHTAVVLGAGLALATAPPPGGVRLVFQPAEELMPGGALDVLAAGVLDGAGTILALHCDPALDVGRVGVRPGPITAAADHVSITVHGPGGHTSRPHRTVDVVYVLARLVVDLPGALSRLVDPRAGASLVFGMAAAGSAPNAIPTTGSVRGTLRVLDRDAWRAMPDLLGPLVERLAAPYGARAEVAYTRGVPPVVNEPAAAALLAAAAEDTLGPGSAVRTAQSLGGEDFGWYLERVPGALARLGVRTPGQPDVDLHQDTFDVDERAIGIGVRVLVRAAEMAAGLAQPASRVGRARSAAT